MKKTTMEHEGDGDTYNNWRVGTVHKGLVQGLEDLEINRQVETIHTRALLISVRLLRRVLNT